MPITTQHTQESLCLSHIYALAGMAGINYAIRKVYDYGVDGQFNTVKERTGRKVDSGVPLNFQAKATIDWELRNGQIVYDLLCLPRDQVNWHLIETQATTMRHCCYYHLLSGEPTENENTKRISIPAGNVLTPDTLNKLLAFENATRQSQIV